MSLRHAGDSDGSEKTSNTRTKSLPSAVVFVVRSSTIGDIGESLEYGTSAPDVNSGDLWDCEIGENLTGAVEDVHSLAGQSISQDRASAEPRQDDVVETAVSTYILCANFNR